jgi:hypothetical protein
MWGVLAGDCRAAGNALDPASLLDVDGVDSNAPQFVGVRDYSQTDVKAFELHEQNTGERQRTPKSSLGVKWSQVQILSARPKKYSLSCVNAFG